MQCSRKKKALSLRNRITAAGGGPVIPTAFFLRVVAVQLYTASDCPIAGGVVAACVFAAGVAKAGKTLSEKYPARNTAQRFNILYVCVGVLVWVCVCVCVRVCTYTT